MTAYLSLPLQFFRFWYFEAPYELFGLFSSLNHAFLQAFSLPLLLRTFFQPAKHEYRKDFIVFSICMGMTLKTPVIIADLLIFLPLLLLELIILIAFLSFPIATILLLLL